MTHTHQRCVRVSDAGIPDEKEARAYPGCVQHPRIPLAIAATGPAGMRLAARYGDLWVTAGTGTSGPFGPAEGSEMVSAQIRCLEGACRQIGRDPSTLRKLVLSGLDIASADPREDG